jgi:hypothetical protein
MKISGGYQGGSISSGSFFGRIGVRSAAAAGAADTGKAVQAAEAAPGVVDRVDYGVYSAVDEFLRLSGDDKIESYSQLSDSGKRKFMKIVDKLAKSGELAPGTLDLGERNSAKDAFLEDYAAYSDNSDQPYGEKGRIAN